MQSDLLSDLCNILSADNAFFFSLRMSDFDSLNPWVIITLRRLTGPYQMSIVIQQYFELFCNTE